MVLDPVDPDSRSAGSFFTNPVVPAERAVPGCPSWPAGDGRVKLSAAWLVQHAGFGRGTRDGRVGTSSRHSLALTTEPGATATELLAFADRIVSAVEEQFGVRLVREPTAVRA
jgi:UDP-N-acetylmuramate dehydrogenase